MEISRYCIILMMLSIPTEGEKMSSHAYDTCCINGTTKCATLKTNKVFTECRCFKQVVFSLRTACL